jgi:Reverse transcriptase (RNA-dependent DNA polymerase)
VRWLLLMIAYCQDNGVLGVSGGCEAAVHATRRFIADMPEEYVVAKLDFSNAFNCVRRDVMLRAVADRLPQLYRFCHLAYNQPSVLRFGRHVIWSEEGAQQREPLGPLLFCLAIQPLLQSTHSPLSFAYIDDVTAGGPAQVVAADIDQIAKMGPSFGLKLNIAKCEILSTHKPTGRSVLAEFQHYTPDTASLLGAPLDQGQAMDKRLSARCEDLARIISRLELISAHDALVLLKNSFSTPRLQFTLRSAPCVGHPRLHIFDNLLRTAASKVCYVTLSDDQRQQARLPVRYGGLGIRRVSSLAPSAFLASAAGSFEYECNSGAYLTSLILPLMIRRLML